MKVNTFSLKVIFNSEIVASYFSNYHDIPFFYDGIVLDELCCSFSWISLPSKGRSADIVGFLLFFLGSYCSLRFKSRDLAICTTRTKIHTILLSP